MIRTRTPFALIAASALLLLAGCSAGGGSTTAAESAAPPVASSAATSPSEAAEAEGGQSKADACQIVIASFSDVVSTSQAMDTSDPQATLAAFTALAEKVQGEFSRITNEEIAPVAQKAGTQLDEYAAFLEGFTADPAQVSEFGAQVTALQESFTQAGTACQG
jgi:hypothetical protein